VSRADIDKADDWFDRYGHIAVLFGRLVPTVRTLISIPAGLSEMSWRTFLVYSGIGTAAWTTLLALLGYGLGSQYEKVAQWIDPVSIGVVILIVAIYLYRVATFSPRKPDRS
jgi:membrane protein DedA with SNARE-associated domain